MNIVRTIVIINLTWPIIPEISIVSPVVVVIRQAIIPATPQVIPTDKVHLKPASRESMTKSLVSVNNTIKSFVSFQYFEIIETIIVISFAIIAA